MLRPLLTLAGLFIISACSSEAPAQSDATTAQAGSVETVSQPASKPKAIKGRTSEKQYIQSMEEGLQSQMKLYSRVSPDAAEKMKPISFNADDRDIIRCSFNGMKRAGLSKYLEVGIEASKALNQAIEDNPDVSIKTLEQYPEIMSLVGGDMLDAMSDTDEEKIQAVNTDCGVMTMILKKMNESGAMAAMTSADMD